MTLYSWEQCWDDSRIQGHNDKGVSDDKHGIDGVLPWLGSQTGWERHFCVPRKICRGDIEQVQDDKL